jgi:hypothetical protein
MDYMLRTNTKEEMEQALLSASLLTIQTIDEQEVKLPVSGLYVDYIGPITKVGQYDENGQEIVAPTTDSRFHVNIRVAFELTQEQLATLPQVDPPPAIPYRVFA